MSRRGTNIYKRKDGRWEGRCKKGVDPNGKTLYRYCYGKTYREVKEKMEDLIRQGGDVKNTPKPPRKPFCLYCDEWRSPDSPQRRSACCRRMSSAV